MYCSSDAISKWSRRLRRGVTMLVHATAVCAVVACGRDTIGTTGAAPVQVFVVAGVEFTALDDLKERSVLWLTDEERLPLLAAADSVEAAVNSGVSARITAAVDRLREQALVLPPPEQSALDLALGDLANLLGVPSFIPPST